MGEFFARVAKRTSDAVGSPAAFVIATLTVIVWAVSGPIFGYSAAWQLVINTGTTIVTFLMVFVIQNAQNRDQKAIQLKLDELLRASVQAKTGFANIEQLDDKALAELEDRSRRLRESHAEDVENALHGTDD